MQLLSRCLGVRVQMRQCVFLVLFVIVSESVVYEVSVTRVASANGDEDEFSGERNWMGNLPVAQPHAESPPMQMMQVPTSDHAESIFLDLSMCFAKRSRVLAIEFFVEDVKPLHENLFRWRILHPIPSLSGAATQWFKLDDAWPVAPSDHSPRDAFPSPGSYRMHILPTPILNSADCVAWSVAGDGNAPFAFQPGGGKVSWARSAEGLHDAVELFVKSGRDPFTNKERPANHIDWTDLMERSFSVRVFYEVVPEPSRPSVPKPYANAAVVDGGNPSCWRAPFSFEDCCKNGGNPTCWDAFFTYERCCTLESVKYYADLDFDLHTKKAHVGHYELKHLSRDNEPRAGPVQDDEALLLYAMVRAMRPLTIVEFGTSHGFSSINWMHAIADDPNALVFSFDILPYPTARTLEDADPRFIFHQKSQTDFEPSDVFHRPVEIAFFDAGHLVEYSIKAFERILPSLSPTAMVAVHDTGMHVRDHGAGAPETEEGLPYTKTSCGNRPNGVERCHQFEGCTGASNEHGYCVGRVHRPSERQFVNEVLRRWPEFRPVHVHSRRVYRHGLTLLQRGTLWDPIDNPSGSF